MTAVPPHKLVGSSGLALPPGIPQGLCKFVFVDEPPAADIASFGQAFWTQCQTLLATCKVARTSLVVQLADSRDVCPYRCASASRNSTLVPRTGATGKPNTLGGPAVHRQHFLPISHWKVGHVSVLKEENTLACLRLSSDSVPRIGSELLATLACECSLIFPTG